MGVAYGGYKVQLGDDDLELFCQEKEEYGLWYNSIGQSLERMKTSKAYDIRVHEAARDEIITAESRPESIPNTPNPISPLTAYFC